MRMLDQLYMTTEGIFGIPLVGLGVLRPDLRAVRLVHGAHRHRTAVHGFRAVDHRSHRRRPRQGVGGQFEPVRHDLGQRRSQRHGGRADLNPADEAHRLSAALRGRCRSHRLDRRSDHAADHGRRRLRDGGVPGRVLRAGRDLGGHPGDPLLRRLLSRRCISRPSAAACSACRAPSCPACGWCCASAATCSSRS